MSFALSRSLLELDSHRRRLNWSLRRISLDVLGVLREGKCKRRAMPRQNLDPWKEMERCLLCKAFNIICATYSQHKCARLVYNILFREVRMAVCNLQHIIQQRFPFSQFSVLHCLSSLCNHFHCKLVQTFLLVQFFIRCSRQFVNPPK